MSHIPVPADELKKRLSQLRIAITQHDPAWSMIILDNKIDLYYFTGTMQDSILIITPDQAVLFIRRSLDCAQKESLFEDIRPMRSFRTIAEDFPHIPDQVYVTTHTMTLQKLSMLQKYLPFTQTRAVDSILSALRAVKSEYELSCMRKAGVVHRYILEEIAPALLRNGISEARLCSSVFTALMAHGAMGISRFNQHFAEDVLGIASFGENSLASLGLDSPSGTVGSCIAMKSIGSPERHLHEGDLVLLDIPGGFRGYHTDKSVTFYYGDLHKHPENSKIRAAREQCIFLERQAASLLRPGAVLAEVYEKLCACVDPTFRDGFMNGCKFIGHSIGLTMDETPVIAKGFTTPNDAGTTLAVEPKIALPGIGLVGCENTYEIVADGPAQSLTGTCDTIFEIID